MEGTAAIRSISTDNGADSHLGANSDRKAAVPTPMGTARIRATAVVTRVPTMKVSAP